MIQYKFVGDYYYSFIYSHTQIVLVLFLYIVPTLKSSDNCTNPSAKTS